MTDRPIIFSAPMVRGLWDGHKTQTRRLMPDQKYLAQAYNPIVSGRCLYNYSGEEVISRARYAPGDRLWVRENWKPHSIYADRAPRDMPRSKVFYAADDGYAPSNTKWVPSIHMPRWASRMTLLVEGVKVERLQDIILQDAFAEGCAIRQIDLFGADADGRRAIGAAYFANLWRSIHGPAAWDANPWVCAISFRVVKSNIDAIKEAA